MPAGQLTRTLAASTNEDWLEEAFRFWVGSRGVADDFTGCSFAAGLRLAGADSTALTLTDANGLLTVTPPNVVAITVPLATMQTLAPGTYDFDLLITYPSGKTVQKLVGQARIAAGIAP